MWPLIEQKYVKNLLRAASCMLQANLVSKTACLRELQRILDSSLVFMLAIVGEKFQTPIIPVWAGYKFATKTFHDYYIPMNILRPVACFQHKLPTGVHLLPDY